LEVDAKLTALSNMNVIDEKPTEGGKKLVKYAQTPIMSTYLVAFVVGELEYIETTFGKNIPIRIYTTLGKKEQARVSLEIGKKAMDYFNE
jgi:aminopeptidase N